MFPKVIFPNAWESLVTSAGGVLTRLVDTDTGVKQAASDLFTKAALEQYRPPKGKFMIHQIGLGSEEDYGFNDNGDAFSRQDLREYHPTFLDGHMFREHLNQDPKHAIGEIKAAGYHPKLHRVELVLWGDREKAASEYEKARNNRGLAFSMACRISYDVCSIKDCQKQAKSPKHYCWHLKHMLGRYIPEKRAYAYAQNPRPRFFDMSAVENPAAIIAQHLQFAFDDEGGLRKAASGGSDIVSGAQWAEWLGLQPDGNIAQAMEPARVQAIRKLASVERWVRGVLSDPNASVRDRALIEAAIDSWDADRTWSFDAIKSAAKAMPGTVFRELAKRAMFLDAPSFFGYLQDVDPAVLKQASDCCGVCQGLPSMFSDAEAEIDATGGLEDVGHLCEPSGALMAHCDNNYDDEVQRAIDGAVSAFSVKAEPLQSRQMTVIIIKRASRVDTAAHLSEAMAHMRKVYAGYKAAAYETAVALNSDLDPDTVALLAVAQNFNAAFNA